MLTDSRFAAYFSGRLKQVFVYLTSRCQLHCRQCLYKPLLKNDSSDIDYCVLTELMRLFKEYGAYKISFLGGEPTLYHDLNYHKNFYDVVTSAKKLGYRYVRVDTNGQFNNAFLYDQGLRFLDEITFSLDGHNSETNDIVRGKGNFDRCVNNIRKAVELGYKVQITSCVHFHTCPSYEIGIKNIINMIDFAESMGVYSINFHPILKSGIARDQWIDNTNIDIDVWAEIYQQVKSLVLEREKSIKIRVPMRFCLKEEAIKNREKYFYCPIEMGERVLVMPDGQLKICAFTIGTDRCIAHFDSEKIQVEEKNSELDRLGTLTVGNLCYHQKQLNEKYVPLCMSYKPNQSELVWKDIKHDAISYNSGWNANCNI